VLASAVWAVSAAGGASAAGAASAAGSSAGADSTVGGGSDGSAGAAATLTEFQSQHTIWFVRQRYLGLLVKSLGWGFAFRSVIGILLTAFTIPPILARIRAEETLLKAQFGDEYEVYRTGTSRLIPWLY
jgi:hypothetical protein